ncbi:MAG TPA: ABC transporter permease [Solirubrobacteraceae bacterium]
MTEPMNEASSRWMSLGEVYCVNRAWLLSRRVLVLECLAVLGLAIGVALLFASQVASTSLDSSVRELTNRIIGSTQLQLDSRDTEGFSETLVAQVERIPGVKAALPVLEQPATITGPKGEASVDLLGVDPRFALAERFLSHLSAKQLARLKALVLPTSLSASVGVGPLEYARVQVGAKVAESYIGTTLGASQIGGLAQSQIALAPIPYVQTLAGSPGRITRIFIQARPGQEAQAKASLERLATRENLILTSANFDARLFSVASAPAQQGEGLFSVISAIIGFLFAFVAMLLTVPERRKSIQEMRDRGTTRLMTVQFLCCEAAMLGVFAAAVGLVFGELLSVHVFRSEPGYLSFAFPVGSARLVTAPTVALAVGLGMIAAFVGVLAPLWTTLARPLQPPIATKHRRSWTTGVLLVTGGLCLVVTTLIVLLRPQAAVAGNVTLLVALLCLLPFLFRGIIAAFGIVQQPLGATSTGLARISLREPTTQTSAQGIAAMGAMAVFGIVAILGAQQNLENGLNRTATEVNDVANLWVSPGGVNNTLGTTPFSSGAASQLRHVRGVQSVSIYRGGFLDIGDRRTWIIAPPSSSPQPIPPGQLTEGNLAVASARLRGHGWAVVSEAIAHEMHLHIGQRFTLPSPRPSTFRVAGLSTNGGWPPGAILINATDYAEAWKTSAASALMITLRPGVSPLQGREEVRRTLGHNSGLAVQTAEQRADEWQTISHQGLARLTEIATLVRIAAILAMAGVMASMMWQRRGRIAYDKRVGHTWLIMWLALFFESTVLLGAGCSIGAVFGVFGQLVISHALATITGFPIVFSTGAVIAVVSFTIVSAAALAIVAIPGYFAARVHPTNVMPPA